MHNIIDQTNDPAHSRLRIVVEQFPALKTMAKTASFSSDEFSGLPSSAFAWPGKRMFPIHNREHTAVSYAFSKLAENHVPTDVQAELDRAMAVYGLDKQAFEAPPPVPEIPEVYLIPEQRRFRVKTAEDVPRVEQAFYEKIRQFDVPERTKIAMRLVDAAKKHDVPVSASTHKLAGFTVTSTRVLRDYIEARKEAALKMGSQMKLAYQGLADQFKDTEPYINDRPYQIKLAQALLEMDQKTGLTPQWGRKLPDPIQTVFNTTKVASEHIKVGSALNNTALLQSLPLEFWQDALGDEITQEIAPNGTVDPQLLATILPTLPADMKATLETQLAAYNTQQ